MADAAPPLLLFVVGPPAVGKMSVGQAIAERTGLRLSHNHLAIELALRYFNYGTPAFRRSDGAIRRLVIEEVAASDLPGLVFTFVWAFNLPEEQAFIDECARPFRERGARVLFVELEATQAERLRRIAGVSRLAEKPSRRDLDASRRDLLDDDARYQLNSRREVRRAAGLPAHQQHTSDPRRGRRTRHRALRPPAPRRGKPNLMTAWCQQGGTYRHYCAIGE